MKLLTVLFWFSFANLVLAENNTISESTSAMLMDMSKDNCIELNQQRLDMRDCCNYPKIPFFRIYATHCIDECVGTKDICCAMICIWRNTKVTFSDDIVNLDGLKKTLLNSVVHKDEWENLISKAVDQCDSEGERNRQPMSLSIKNLFSFTVKQESQSEYRYKMCKIPTHLPGLVNCAIKKLFLMCPNMHKSSRCETTRKYVEECL